jgi:hypothetical protein
MKLARLSVLGTARFTFRRRPNYSFLLEAESTPRPEELSQWKIPMTPSWIEPATCQFVAQVPQPSAPLPAMWGEQNDFQREELP